MPQGARKKPKTRSVVIIGGVPSQYPITKLLKHKEVVQTLEQGWNSECTLSWRPSLHLPDVYVIHNLDDKETRRQKQRAARREASAAAGAGPGPARRKAAGGQGRHGSADSAGGSVSGGGTLPPLDLAGKPSSVTSTPGWRALPPYVAAAESAGLVSPTVASILKRPVTVIREIPTFPKNLSDFLVAQQGYRRTYAGPGARAGGSGGSSGGGSSGGGSSGGDLEPENSGKATAREGDSADDDASPAPAPAPTPGRPLSPDSADWLSKNIWRSRQEARAELARQRLEEVQRTRDTLLRTVRRGQQQEAADAVLGADAEPGSGATFMTTTESGEGQRKGNGNGQEGEQQQEVDGNGGSKEEEEEEVVEVLQSSQLSTEMRRALNAGVSAEDGAVDEARRLLRALIRREEASQAAQELAAEQRLRHAEDELLQQIARSQVSGYMNERRGEWVGG